MTIAFNREVDRVHPAEAGQAVTPNDATDLPTVARAIYVGVSGDVKLTSNTGSTYTLTNLIAGIVHPIQAKRIWSTGTTATNIVALQ